MKFQLKYLLLILALSVAGCAAYFSVLGLSQLFAGASVAVIIMASVLEIGKIVTTTALHHYWNRLAKPLKYYLTISVIILMLITSAGIYGFLSNAYQTTANKLEIQDSEIGLLNTKKELFEKTILDNKQLIETKNNRLSQLSNLRVNQESRLDNSISNRDRNNTRKDIQNANLEIEKLNNEINLLNETNFSLTDSINKYNIIAIEIVSSSSITAEIGPLKYIAEVTGLPIASVVNYLILLLIFVFDPLAVALVLITNKVFQLENKTTEKTKEYFTPIKTEKIGKQIKTETKNNFRYQKPTFIDEPSETFVDDDYDDEPEQTIEPEETIEPEQTNEPEETIEPEETNEPVKKITLEDIKEIKERNRGFSVNIPEPKSNNMIQRIGKRRQ
jgi:hypothetical protein